MPFLGKRAPTSLAALACVGSAIRWAGRPTLFTAIPPTPSRSGCPALDLCAVAAGAAIAEAAGATIVELQSDLVPSPVLVAANAQLLKALVAVLIEVGVAMEPRAGLA
jgi:hypothetical protein